MQERHGTASQSTHQQWVPHDLPAQDIRIAAVPAFQIPWNHGRGRVLATWHAEVRIKFMEHLSELRFIDKAHWQITPYDYVLSNAISQHRLSWMTTSILIMTPETTSWTMTGCGQKWRQKGLQITMILFHQLWLVLNVCTVDSNVPSLQMPTIPTYRWWNLCGAS